MTNSSMILVYVADPMCSWCWGFAPVIQALQKQYCERMDFQLVMGGLRPGPAAEPVDDRMKAYLRHHWQRVQAMTGQPFDFGFFERTGHIYDTEPASRAVVTVRRLRPRHELAYFHTLQQGYYLNGIDVTRPQACAEFARIYEIDDEEFLTTYAEEKTEQATHNDYALARRMGANAFPALLVRKDGMVMPVSSGYLPLEAVVPRIDRALAALV